METRGQALTENDCHVSLKKAEVYESYGQVMAIWSQKSLSSEEAWERFFVIRDDLISKLPEEKAAICTTCAQYRAALAKGKSPFFLAVEDARLLCGRYERLETLYRCGVRFLTPVWRDESCIGGAFNTEAGLTDFGRDAVRGALALGMVIDLSHASDIMMEEILAMAREAGRPVVATHSNSRAVCNHKRNLTDGVARAIAETGGVFGINMVPFHLSEDSVADARSVCRHILHFLSLGLEDAVCFGCDLDGMDVTPEGIRNVGDILTIADALRAHGVSETVIEKIFFKNADRFLQRVF